jgi:hypothetical protein
MPVAHSRTFFAVFDGNGLAGVEKVERIALIALRDDLLAILIRYRM